MHQRLRQEDRSPILILVLRLANYAGWIYIVTGRHGQQILHGQCLQVVAYLGRRLVGEEVEHFVSQLQLTLAHGEAYRCGGEGLADGVQHMWSLGIALAQPLLLEYLTTLQHHHTVQILSRFFYRFQVGIERLV